MTRADRAVRRLSLAALIALAVGSPVAAQQPQRMPPGMPPGMPGMPAMPRALEPTITVQGSGSAAARPDTAEVTAGVLTQGPTAAQALAQNTAGMDAVLKAVAAAGVPERDVQTTSVSVVPQRRQLRQDAQPPEILGYEVTNQVRIKVRDLTKLGRLLDALVAQGANVLGGISFSVADPAALLDQARAKAMADARRKADVYAAAAGVGVGRLISVSEGGGPVVQPTAMPRLMSAAPVPVAAGEQEFQVSVTVVFGIK